MLTRVFSAAAFAVTVNSAASGCRDENGCHTSADSTYDQLSTCHASAYVAAKSPAVLSVMAISTLAFTEMSPEQGSHDAITPLVLTSCSSQCWSSGSRLMRENHATAAAGFSV